MTAGQKPRWIREKISYRENKCAQRGARDITQAKTNPPA